MILGWFIKALEAIWIFLRDGRTNEGVPRGPRGPKKVLETATCLKFKQVFGILEFDSAHMDCGHNVLSITGKQWTLQVGTPAAGINLKHNEFCQVNTGFFMFYVQERHNRFMFYVQRRHNWRLKTKTNIKTMTKTCHGLWNVWNCWHFRQLRTWIDDSHCDLTIKNDTGQHSQSLQCLVCTY